MLRPARLVMLIGFTWMAYAAGLSSAYAQREPAKGEPTKSEAAPPKFPSIAAAVQALGHDEFVVRQDASEYLWRTGASALALLETAGKSPDAEVRLRATLLLRKIKLGITPDTPAEVQHLIAAYYDGDRNARQQVINQLRQQGAFKTLFGLLQVETDATTRQLFFTTLQSDVHRLAPQMQAAGDWSLLEQWLELGKGSDAGRAQLTAYLLLREKLPDELVKAQQELAKAPGDATLASLVACLLRAQGDSQQALAVVNAAKLPSPLLLQGLAREQGDWLRLAAAHETKAANPRLELHRHAIRAMSFRLAHDQENAAAAFEQVTTLAPMDDVWYAAKVLLLNDRPQEAIKLLSPALQPMAFELLAQRQEHQAALKLAGITDETQFNEAWLSQLTGQQSVRTSRTVDRFLFAVNIAAELRLLGKQKQYDELHEFLMKTAEADDQRGLSWQHLARLERLPGRHAALLDRNARTVERNHSVILNQMFGKKLFPAAMAWWEIANLDARLRTADERLTAVAVALLPKTFKTEAELAWPPLREFAEAKAAEPMIEPELKAKLHGALAEAWSIRGDKERAETHRQAAADALPAAAEAYGDLLLADKRWADAAAQYRRLVEANPGHTPGWYLQGLALVRAGQKEEGGKLQHTANLMALDANARYALALALQDRDLKDEAREQWQLLQRTGFPEDQVVTIANQYLGNLVAEKNPLAAARHWEQLRFHLLKPTTNLIEQAGYLDLAATVHRLQARHLLAAGDKAGAVAELKLCEQMLPGSIKLVEDFVPLLHKAEMDEAADDLFENCFQTYSQATHQFPDSAALHNQAAWVAAISGRRLDDALSLAEDAVRLAPENASYLDTLAEVHFARGDREQALEWSRKALALDPDSKFHAERLQGFSTRELPAK